MVWWSAAVRAAMVRLSLCEAHIALINNLRPMLGSYPKCFQCFRLGNRSRREALEHFNLEIPDGREPTEGEEEIREVNRAEVSCIAGLNNPPGGDIFRTRFFQTRLTLHCEDTHIYSEFVETFPKMSVSTLLQEHRSLQGNRR